LKQKSLKKIAFKLKTNQKVDKITLPRKKIDSLPFMAAKNEKNVDYEIRDAADDAVVTSDSSHDEQDDGGDDEEAGQHDHHDAEDLDTFDVRKYM
jgi:hypothetical protein